MNNRYKNLLDSRGLATEDATTFALSDLLASSTEIRMLLLEFLYGGGLPDPVRKDIGRLRVMPQFSFSGRAEVNPQSLGRIDLALIAPDGSYMVGVEFKVRDAEKPGRLKNYKIVMDGEFAGPNWLFEVVQRREHQISEKIVHAVHTWNELHKFFGGRLGAIKSRDQRSRLAEYLDFLSLSSTSLPVGVLLERTPASLPHAPSAQECIERFERFGSLLPSEINWDVESDKKVPPQLRLGKSKWREKFKMEWFQRIWLNLRIEPESGRRYVYGSIIFHNANHSKFDYSRMMLPLWAPICSKAGLRIWRGPNKGWDGSKRVELLSSWTLDGTPKYFYAEDDWDEATAMVKARRETSKEGFLDYEKPLKKLLKLVDSFPDSF